MIALLLGLVVLVVAVQVLRWAASADVKQVRKAINWAGVVVIGLVILFLAATGRMGAAIGGLIALAAWGVRIMSMLHMGRQFSAMFRSFRFGGGASTGPQSSDVSSAYLRMHLDHDTGALDGEVTQGRFQGSTLKSLSEKDLLELLQDVAADQSSVGLLEAYLDRTHPDWREGRGGEQAPGNPPPQGAMTTEEAHRILGLNPGATDEEIKSAYRRLMGQLHPDHGGTDYLAAKVNQAKDFLLKR